MRRNYAIRVFGEGYWYDAREGPKKNDVHMRQRSIKSSRDIIVETPAMHITPNHSVPADATHLTDIGALIIASGQWLSRRRRRWWSPCATLLKMHGGEESCNGGIDDSAGVVDGRSVEGLELGSADRCRRCKKVWRVGDGDS
jgi:hypothetical protein